MNISFEFVALVLSIAGCIGIASLFHVGKWEKICFLIIFTILGISALFNSLAFIYNGIDGEGIGSLVSAFKFIALDSTVLLASVFSYRLIHLIGKKEIIFYKVYAIAVLAIAGIMTVLLVVNIFTGIFYVVDENNVYVRGKAFLVIPLVEIVMWIIDAVILFLNRHVLTKQDRVIFTLYLFLLVAAAILEILFPHIAFFDIATSIAIVVLLFGEQSKATDQLFAEKVAAEEARTEVAMIKEKLFCRQVSPHFIYNSLTAIQALPNNPEITKRAIGDFAKYLRQTISTINETTLIPFTKELENVQAYFRLEKIRFGDNLKFKYDIAEKDFDLPAMSVQIFAENAVKHGVSVKREGGTIAISTWKDERNIYIEIADDGVGFDVRQKLDSSHIGIENVINRVKSFVSGEVNIKSELGVGTTVTLTIPIK